MSVAGCQSPFHCGSDGGGEKTWGKDAGVASQRLAIMVTHGRRSNGQEILATQGQFFTAAKFLRVIPILTVPASRAAVPRSPLKPGTVGGIKYKFLSV